MLLGLVGGVMVGDGLVDWFASLADATAASNQSAHKILAQWIAYAVTC